MPENERKTEQNELMIEGGIKIMLLTCSCAKYFESSNFRRMRKMPKGLVCYLQTGHDSPL